MTSISFFFFFLTYYIHSGSERLRKLQILCIQLECNLWNPDRLRMDINNIFLDSLYLQTARERVGDDGIEAGNHLSLYSAECD